MRGSVHPRVCGEHTLERPNTEHATVHPRVCGEHIGPSIQALHAFDRFIPACAGNIFQTLRSAWPLMRFIPACAGNIERI